jgi:hypothetical protein
MGSSMFLIGGNKSAYVERSSSSLSLDEMSVEESVESILRARVRCNGERLVFDIEERVRCAAMLSSLGKLSCVDEALAMVLEAIPSVPSILSDSSSEGVGVLNGSVEASSELDMLSGG